MLQTERKVRCPECNEPEEALPRDSEEVAVECERCGIIYDGVRYRRTEALYESGR